MPAQHVEDVRGHGRYLILVGILTPLFAAIFYIALLVSSSLSCGQGFGKADDFLGYCETTWFGDYEHAVAAYDTKPAFSRNAAAADVLSLGDSRMQTAMSTEAVHRYFHDRGARFFAFGFGYGETARFPLALMKQIDARPKIVIINADGFFSGNMSPVAASILEGSRWERWKTYLHYLPKTIFERTAGSLCASAGPICTMHRQPRSWMRSVEDGRWTWINGDPDRADRSIGSSRDRPFDPGLAMRQRAAAEQAIAQLRALDVDPSCVIFTGVPNPVFPSEASAKALATMLKVPLVQPRLTGLSVRDGLHLSQPSAEIWSAALLREAEPIIDRCLAGSSR